MITELSQFFVNLADEIKAGLAGSDSPTLVFPNVIGKFRDGMVSATGGNEPLFGEDTQTNKQ
jgi:actin-related protein